MSNQRLAPKDPADVVDYGVDWSRVIGTDDAIASSSWTLPTAIPDTTPLTTTANTFTVDHTYIWVAGGQALLSYALTNTIMTVLGRTFQRTITFYVKDL